MIVLDENISERDAAELQRQGVRCRRIGTDLGHRGMDDQNDIVPLLHRLHQPTFFTNDVHFYMPALRHAGYCLVMLDVPALQVTTYIRRFLRHPEFRTAAQRMGCVARVSPSGIAIWHRGAQQEQHANWE